MGHVEDVSRTCLECVRMRAHEDLGCPSDPDISLSWWCALGHWDGLSGIRVDIENMREMASWLYKARSCQDFKPEPWAAGSFQRSLAKEQAAGHRKGD